MTSLHVICCLAPYPIHNPGNAYASNHVQCAYQIPVVASLYRYVHLHQWLLTTLQRCKIYNALLLVKKFFWHGSIEWNGRFFVQNGNGMEENCQYGIWKNYLPFHSIKCPVYCKLNLIHLQSSLIVCLHLKRL